MANERRVHPFIQFSLQGLVIIVLVAGVLLGVLVSTIQEKAIPFCWCGKPTGGLRNGLGTRDGIHLYPNAVMTEDELAHELDRLNAHLKAMGIPPVSPNVPDDVDWAKFEKN